MTKYLFTVPELNDSIDKMKNIALNNVEREVLNLHKGDQVSLVDLMDIILRLRQAEIAFFEIEEREDEGHILIFKERKIDQVS
jgi:hypothetical protein